MCELDRCLGTREISQLRVAFIFSERNTEFVSKINKSVVTVRRGHFMNSVSVSPGIYSCAVDPSLEISTHLFLP